MTAGCVAGEREQPLASIERQLLSDNFLYYRSACNVNSIVLKFVEHCNNVVFLTNYKREL